MYKETLYMQDAKGMVRVWAIEADPDMGMIMMEYGIEGGSMQTKTEDIPAGKAGRTLQEQTYSRFMSRINKQKDKGYSERSTAELKATNGMGFPKPMLAQNFNDVEVDYKSAYIQRKYDGNRCIMANIDGKIIAYSRNGKEIKAIKHITNHIIMPEGYYVDGELYAHGERLQTIVSWIKREQEDTAKIQYMIYDVIKPLPFGVRFYLLDEVAGPNVHIAPTMPVKHDAQAIDYLKDFRDDGYEGAILRWGTDGYEDGKRSKSLLKLKEWHDDEFVVIGIEPSRDYWAILTCVMPCGKAFRVSAPGSMAEKEYVLLAKKDYMGRKVTVEYAYLTDEGRPFHPIAKAWR